MKTTSGIVKLPGRKKTVLAIGVFDGVHLGHQSILKKVVTRARALKATSAVLTFSAAPEKVIAPDYAPAAITSLTQKLDLIEASGVSLTVVARFDRAFAAQSPETFVQNLVQKLRVREVVVGEDFVFGARAAGNTWLLKKLGVKFGFKVHVLKPKYLAGRPISSTRIRECLASGKLEETAKMLGRPFSLTGKIQRGDQVGRKLGYPTANLKPEQEILPLKGVWGGRARILPGKSWHATLVNIGTRPTLGEKFLRTELHLLDFSGNLYGSRLELEFLRFLRAEKRFKNLQALQKQIRLDEVHFRRFMAFHSVFRISGG